MDENEQDKKQEQTSGKAAKPKNKKAKTKEVITFVCLGVAVVCVVALLVISVCFT